MNVFNSNIATLNKDLECLLIDKISHNLKITDLIKATGSSYKTKIVYIAGKVTGLDPAHVQAKFNQRKEELIAAGYIVINPCVYISADTDWKLAMAICFILLPNANYISLLHDWQDSKGAVMEKEFADKMGIEILTL